MAKSLGEMMVERHNAIVTERIKRRRMIILKGAKTRGYNSRRKGMNAFGNPYTDNDLQASWREGWNLANEEIEENHRVIYRLK